MRRLILATVTGIAAYYWYTNHRIKTQGAPAYLPPPNGTPYQIPLAQTRPPLQTIENPFTGLMDRIFNVPDAIKPPPTTNPAQTPPAPSAPRKWMTPAAGQKYEVLFSSASQQYGLPDGLLSRVAYQESRYNPNAFNKGSKASGIMQIVPRWHPGVDVWNPDKAIPYAAKYLAQLKRLLGTWPKALAGYNWGQGNVIDKALPYGDKWLEHVPAETYHYVIDVTRDTGIG